MKIFILLILIIVICIINNLPIKDHYDSEDSLYYMNVTDWDTGKKEVLIIDFSKEAQEELAEWERKHGGCIAP